MSNGQVRTPTVLDGIVARKQEEVARLRPRAAELRARAADAPPARDFAGALRDPGEVRLLAEVKRRSPSAGPIRPEADAVDVATRYAAAGAAAVSVLTDAEFFGGALEDLRRVASGVQLPVLRKDFVIDALQLFEARAAGADAVLLIARLLDGAALTELLGLARSLGMEALVEVHTRVELDGALAVGALLVGINNRDLAVFRTDLALSRELAPRVPAQVTLVAESGIQGPADVDLLGDAGIDAVLVGEALMRAADPGRAAAALVGRRKRDGVRS